MLHFGRGGGGIRRLNPHDPQLGREWAAVMDGTRPALIRDDDLRAYIKSKRESRSIKIQFDTFYCLRCRKERRAAKEMADCEIKHGRAKLMALCETCATVVSKPVAEASIPKIGRTLDLKITRH